LLAKLYFYSIQGTVSNWLRSDVTNRKQKTEINSLNAAQFSLNWGTVKHGVLQGSILGPLLFIIYINGLSPRNDTISEPIIFADDTNVIISSKNCDDFCMSTNTFLVYMNKWFMGNKVALNLGRNKYNKIYNK
jgi:hypothetical protein